MSTRKKGMEWNGIEKPDGNLIKINVFDMSCNNFLSCTAMSCIEIQHFTTLLSEYEQNHTIKKAFTFCKCYKHQKKILWLGFNQTCFHSFCKNSTETNSMRSHHTQES